jgi:hypothetical protein
MGTSSLLAILTQHGKNISNIEEFMAQFKLWKEHGSDGNVEHFGVAIYKFLKKLLQNGQWQDFVNKVEKIETKLPPHVQALYDNFDLNHDIHMVRYHVRMLLRGTNITDVDEIDIDDERILKLYDKVLSTSTYFSCSFIRNGKAFWNNSQEFARDFKLVWPFNRNCEGPIFKMIMARKENEAFYTQFASADWPCQSTFCEWGYVIDCEKAQLHVLCNGLEATSTDDILFPLDNFVAKNDKWPKPYEFVHYAPIGTICVFDIFNLPETSEEFVKIVVDKGKEMDALE